MKTYNKNPEAVSLLTPEQYRVTQQDGTERPFQNEYWDNKEPGLCDALLIRGPCRAALGKRAIDTRSGRHWHWQSRGATDTVRLAQPFPPRRADSLLPSNSPRRIWCRLDASVSPYRQDELNRAGRSSTPGGQGAGHYQRDRPA
jgi:SelR domain